MTDFKNEYAKLYLDTVKLGRSQLQHQPTDDGFIYLDTYSLISAIQGKDVGDNFTCHFKLFEKEYTHTSAPDNVKERILIEMRKYIKRSKEKQNDKKKKQGETK